VTRLLSGVTLAALSAGVIIWSAPLAFFVFIAVFVTAGLFEYFQMLKSAGEPVIPGVGIVAGLALFSAVSLGGAIGALSFTPLIFIGVMGWATLLHHGDSYKTASNTLFGAFYIGLTLSQLVLVRYMSDGVLLILLLAFANTFCDSLAYYIGKNFGKTPLAPSISPNKTVEGFVGGLAGALLISTVFAHFLMPGFGLRHAVVVGLIAGLAGPMGDLAESSLKRNMRIKDSGSLIPGHGGALDRMDSWLFTAPVFYVYLRFVVGA
jgi:phosphatidate cytidylyltransferase